MAIFDREKNNTDQGQNGQFTAGKMNGFRITTGRPYLPVRTVRIRTGVRKGVSCVRLDIFVRLLQKTVSYVAIGHIFWKKLSLLSGQVKIQNGQIQMSDLKKHLSVLCQISINCRKEKSKMSQVNNAEIILSLLPHFQRSKILT